MNSFCKDGYETSLVCAKYAAPLVTSGVQENTWPAGNVQLLSHCAKYHF